MNRRFGTPPLANQTYTPRPGVYAIIDAGDGILATLQDDPSDPELQLPGGGIDPGESPQRALVREVMEETGYRIHSPRRLGMFHRFTYMPEYNLYAHKHCHIYLAKLAPRHGPPTDAGHVPVFLPWDVAAERLAVAGDRFFISQAIRMRSHR